MFKQLFIITLITFFCLGSAYAGEKIRQPSLKKKGMTIYLEQHDEEINNPTYCDETSDGEETSLITPTLPDLVSNHLEIQLKELFVICNQRLTFHDYFASSDLPPPGVCSYSRA